MTEQKKEKTTITTKQENITIIQTGENSVIMRNDGVININIGDEKTRAARR